HYDFSGRHAVITGGAAGIGLAIATRLVEGGATVTLWDRDEDALHQAQDALGADHVHISKVDVESETSVESALADTLRRYKDGIDVLVTSAGITGANATVCDYSV